MPLDVQPLSATRRAIMLGVILLLLGGSLAFAQVLVARKTRVNRVTVSVNWNLPAVFDTAVPDLENAGDVQIAREGTVGGLPRQVVGLVKRMDAVGPEDMESAAESMFAGVFGSEPAEKTTGNLAHRPGLEVEGVAGDRHFAVLRLVPASGNAVAICYSGAGEMTDADKLYFNGLCNRVAIRAKAPHTGK